MNNFFSKSRIKKFIAVVVEIDFLHKPCKICKNPSTVVQMGGKGREKDNFFEARFPPKVTENETLDKNTYYRETTGRILTIYVSKQFY